MWYEERRSSPGICGVRTSANRVLPPSRAHHRPPIVSATRLSAPCSPSYRRLLCEVAFVRIASCLCSAGELAPLHDRRREGDPCSHTTSLNPSICTSTPPHPFPPYSSTRPPTAYISHKCLYPYHSALHSSFVVHSYQAPTQPRPDKTRPISSSYKYDSLVYPHLPASHFRNTDSSTPSSFFPYTHRHTFATYLQASL
jgi:hypothetical protein